MADVSPVPAQGPAVPPRGSMATRDIATDGIQGPPSLAALMEQMQQLETFRNIYAQMMAHAKEAEKPPTLYAAADVPIFVDCLSSNEPETFNKGSQGLASIVRHQPDLAKSDIVPLIPPILSLMTAAPDEPRRIAMIGLSSTIQGSSQEASDAFKVHLDVEEAAAMVKKSGPEASEEKKALLNLLETTLRTSRRKESEKARSEMEGNFAKALRTRLDAVGQENTAIEAKGKGRASVSSGGWTAEEVFSFIKTLELIPGDEYYITVRSAFLGAGALEFLIRVATTRTLSPYALPLISTTDSVPPSPSITALRVAAISCLGVLYRHIVKETVVPSDFSHMSFLPDAKFDLQGRILMPLLDMIDDADIDISDRVVDFMFSRYKDTDGAVEVYLWTHEGSIERVVHKLAMSGRKQESEQDRITRLAMVQSLGTNPFEMLGLPDVGVQQVVTDQREQQQPVTDGNQESNNPVPAQEVEDQKRPSGADQATQQDVPKDVEGSDKPLIQTEDDKVVEGEGMKPEPSPSTEGTQQQAAPGELQQSVTLGKEPPVHSEDQKTLDSRPAPAPAQGQKALSLSAAQQSFLAMLTWSDNHSKVEMLLGRLLRRNLGGGVDAFETFWAQRDLEERTRKRLLQALSGATDIVRNAATIAGVPVATQDSGNAEPSVHMVEEPPVGNPEEKARMLSVGGGAASENRGMNVGLTTLRRLN